MLLGARRAQRLVSQRRQKLNHGGSSVNDVSVATGSMHERLLGQGRHNLSQHLGLRRVVDRSVLHDEDDTT